MENNQPMRCGDLFGFSVDVEDWFHTLEAGATPSQVLWPRLENRVIFSTRLLLDLLAESETRATFFVLGWVAEHYPSLVREIVSRGHEVGSHGYAHELLYHMDPDSLKVDLDRAKKATEDAIGSAVNGYRAPGFSIRSDSLWALPVIADAGFTYDASGFLGPHTYGGQLGDTERAYEAAASRSGLVTVSVRPRRILTRSLPYSGGGYLRALPYWLLRDSFEKARGNGGSILYVHPRDVDVGQPRLAGLRFPRSLYHYYGVHSTAGKLRLLLARFPFVPLREIVARRRSG